MDKSLKRYNKDILLKDFWISYLAGIAGGFTVWIFILISPFLSNKEYFKFFIGFILFIVFSTLFFFVAYRNIRGTFGKG